LRAFPGYEMAVIVSDAVVLQYLGFETKGAVREYTFTLRGSGGESSEYFVIIPNAAFVVHRVRYQDAPNICSLRLRREFASPNILLLLAFVSRTQNWPITRTPTPRNRSPAPLPSRATTSLDVSRLTFIRGRLGEFLARQIEDEFGHVQQLI
jgi:hypothetical protein